jgi:hypothetical protein
MVSLLSFPNIRIEIRADKTNIQANEQMKVANSAFELIKEARPGVKPLIDDATVVRADCVKIW